jgi:hypothetical protein
MWCTIQPEKASHKHSNHEAETFFWAYLLLVTRNLLVWRECVQIAFQTFFPELLLCCFLLDIERMRPLALNHGIDIQIYMCKI